MVDVGFQLSEVDSNIVVFSFMLAMHLCFSRSVTSVGIVISLLGTFIYQYIDVSFVVIRNYFPQENPETVTVWLFLISAGGLFFHMLRKKTRSRDRLFMFLAISSMTVVTGLFHFAAIEQTLLTWKERTNLLNTQLLPLDDMTFMGKCQERGLICYTGSHIESFFPEIDLHVIEGIRKTGVDVRSKDLEKPVYIPYSSLTGLYKKYFIVFFSDKGNQRVIIDERSAVLAHETSRRAFYYLATFAHGVWLLGVLFLIWFHRRVIARIQQRNRWR